MTYNGYYIILQCTHTALPTMYGGECEVSIRGPSRFSGGKEKTTLKETCVYREEEDFISVQEHVTLL